jgi:hypothetical protein
MILPYYTRPGVNVYGLNWRMRIAEDVLVEVWREFTGDTFTMTSGADRAHSSRSWHYKGMAFDAGLSGVSLVKAPQIFRRLKERLGPPFQLVHHEGSHIHVECDLVAYPEWIARDITEAVRP